ncbi:hypothetical protein [Nakamurella endophytica]|uniref:Serpin (Serine protease inhibitor) n=1 Tax=Nakamurella endophytica TaxID=1748367 RepID=A0A917WEQ7_9ACTN|nr:hypothetical protein [Nakamurella endophytica]GGL96386.1 hypothetical protein GCM10011594_15180 [Nakamurella endophytica]
MSSDTDPSERPADLRHAVARYADRLHGGIGTGHHVASPLGAWLLLAVAASAEPGAGELAGALGMPPDRAAAHARGLLAAPPTAVAAAAGLWTQLDPDRVGRWRSRLPATVPVGPVPGQAALDAWAAERTGGLVERFPVQVDATTVLVLATALATRIAWWSPFDTAPGAELGGPWAARLRHVLRTPTRGHHCWIGTHPVAGDVAVHGTTGDGLRVTSVIGAPDVPAAAVLAAAHDAAAGSLPARSLFDLPLGDGPCWTVTQDPTGPSGEQCTALLPAWSANSRHDLSRPELGFGAAAAALVPEVDRWTAAQAAVARYGRRGFEAAAVTGMAVMMSARVEQSGPRRDAVLRFGHPYAVVATVTDRGPWHGLPVFSAWVAEPEDADDAETGPGPRR